MLYLLNLTLFFLQTNFSRGAGWCLSYVWKIQRGGGGGGGGGYRFRKKMKNPGRWGGRGGLREIPSVVGVWIFSGNTQCNLLIRQG